MIRRIIPFIKRELVFCLALLLAILSAFFVPPSREYVSYIDFRVLGLLWCLMTVVAGLRSCGVFDALSAALLHRNVSRGRMLSVILVMLPFFASMAVTNDVALLTFVPFTIGLLSSAKCEKVIPPMLVLQTLAANLGSMATPVGNPQNLYLYGAYSMTASEFFSAVLPFAGVAFVLLTLCALPLLPESFPVAHLPPVPAKKKKLLFFTVLFALCLLSVFRFLAWQWLLAAVFLSVLLFDRRLIAAADYPLILTFICFFIFSGNLGKIDAVNAALRAWMGKNAFLTAVLASQVISNVPAAVLLSGFTDAGTALLLGTDIGGLGTPVASLASLITLKFYLHTPNRRAGRFLAVFLGANAAFLAIFLAIYALLN